MLSNLTSFINLNFGDLTAFNFANQFFYIHKNAKGEVFQLTTNWIPEDSKIIFDEGAELDLIPQQPYFISFNRKITLKIRNPFFTFPTGTIAGMASLKGIVFLERNSYYKVSQEKQFYIIFNNTSGATTRLQPHLGAKYQHIQYYQSDLVNGISCIKVVKNPISGFALGYCPCVGYLSFDKASVTNFENDMKRLSVENNGDCLQFESIYSATSTTDYFFVTYSDIGNEAYNESQLYDRKPGLALNTTYEFFYQIPKHVKNAYVRISDMAATPFQNIWYTVCFINSGINTLLQTAAVSSIGGTVVDWGSASKLRVVVLTNLAVVNDLSIYTGWRH